MFAFIADNIATILVLLVVIAIVGFSLWKTIKAPKCGSSCGGGCSGCSLNSKCRK